MEAGLKQNKIDARNDAFESFKITRDNLFKKAHNTSHMRKWTRNKAIEAKQLDKTTKQENA